MGLSEIAKRAQKLTIDNSPALLTAIGVTGSLTAAYLTGKASFKAAQIIQEQQERLDMHEQTHQLETKEKVELVWKEYIPAVGVAAITVVSIVGANRIGTRRAAAVAAAYSLSERAFSEYKEKVVQKMGEKKEQGLRDEIAQERVAKNPPTGQQVIIGGGDVLCYEMYTGRYFKSDMETLKKAMNDTNYMVLNNNYASLSDFYNKVGLPWTQISEEVGWNCNELLELKFSTTLADDGRPCLAFDYNVTPIRGYYRIH